MAKHTILCVDDEVDNVDALERLLRKNYRVLKATSGPDALEILKKENVSLIISDQRMPQMSGVEFLTRSIESHPDVIRILLTGYTDVESVIAAINSGQIYRYVTKPWDPIDLTNAVDKAIERFDLGHELKLKNAQLKTALEELQRLDQTKTEFMLLINHELKTPLTSIISFSDLLSESKLDEDQSKFLTRIRSSAGRLNQLISDVMEFLSAETGQMKISKTELNPQLILQEQIARWENLAAEKHLKSQTDIAQSLVKADGQIIRNVLGRLIHNCIKFAKPGSAISITGKVEQKNYRIELKNTSDRSLSSDQIQKILKPFQLDENIMHHSTGTGLGLSISQSLLKLHSADFQFSSSGDVVTASFLLPLA